MSLFLQAYIEAKLEYKRRSCTFSSGFVDPKNPSSSGYNLGRERGMLILVVDEEYPI